MSLNRGDAHPKFPELTVTSSNNLFYLSNNPKPNDINNRKSSKSSYFCLINDKQLTDDQNSRGKSLCKVKWVFSSGDIPGM